MVITDNILDQQNSMFYTVRKTTVKHNPVFNGIYITIIVESYKNHKPNKIIKDNHVF